MIPSEFLRLLWGAAPPGWVQLWRLQGRATGSLRNLALADKLQGKSDWYTAVSTSPRKLEQHERCKAAEVMALAGMWLDLDLAHDEKEGGAPSEAAALEVASHHLEPTIVVRSGHGLHCWWLFEEPWILDVDTRPKAQVMAAQWHRLHDRLANAQGWKIDPAHDLARLLRLPGTINAKRDPVPVEVAECEGSRFDLPVLAELADQAGPVAVPAPSTPGEVADLDSAEFDLLLQRSEAFRRSWQHEQDGFSMSERDLSLCSIAAASGWTDGQLRALIVHHRNEREPGGTKQLRPDYLDRTVAKALERAHRTQPQASKGVITFNPGQWGDAILEALEAPDDASVPLPFGELNDAVDGGLRPGDVCLVAGYTSHGKSVYVDMLADKAAQQGRQVHLYMTEMSAAQRGLRLLARRTGIPFRDLRRRHLGKEQWRQITAELQRLPYGCSIVADANVDQVVDHIRQNRWDLAVIDLVHGFHYTDERELSKSSSALVRAAKGWQPGCAIVAAAHLNDGQMRDSRSPRRPKPGLHSIKGSSSLKQDADLVVFVWLEDDDTGQPTSDGAVWIGKNRQGGFAAVDVRLNTTRMRFEHPVAPGTVAEVSA